MKPPFSKASEAARSGFQSLIGVAGTVDDLAKAFRRAQRRFATITLSDTGTGMSVDELEGNFLMIGTASRKKAVDAALAASAKETPYFGEKGIGRLSAMRLGERLRVETARTTDRRSSNQQFSRADRPLIAWP